MSSSLIIAQQYLTRYEMTIYLTLGNIGLIFNMFIFGQSIHRRNSCSLYILTMSFFSLIGLNSAIIPVIYALDHPNPLSYSLVFCKLQYYLRHAFSQLMRMFFVLACANHYVTTSNRASIRSFGQYRVAIRVIPSVTVFWLLLAIFPTMLHSITNGVCDVMSGLPYVMYSVYSLAVIGIFPIVSMITFGVLLTINLKEMRTRIHSVTNPGNAVNIFRKRDRDMLRMLLVDLIIYVCTIMPNTLVLIYMISVQTKTENYEHKQIILFISYFARVFLLYLNNGLPFWIFLSTSRSFRLEFKNLIIKWWTFIRRENIQMNRIH